MIKINYIIHLWLIRLIFWLILWNFYNQLVENSRFFEHLLKIIASHSISGNFSVCSLQRTICKMLVESSSFVFPITLLLLTESGKIWFQTSCTSLQMNKEVLPFLGPVCLCSYSLNQFMKLLRVKLTNLLWVNLA